VHLRGGAGHCCLLGFPFAPGVPASTGLSVSFTVGFGWLLTGAWALMLWLTNALAPPPSLSHGLWVMGCTMVAEKNTFPLSAFYPDSRKVSIPTAPQYLHEIFLMVKSVKSRRSFLLERFILCNIPRCH